MSKKVEPIIDWIKALKARHKIQVKIFRCDNAGVNKVLERESDKIELGIIFEYTAPGTPQQNGVVERAFVTAMGRARAMMNHAGFTMAKRQQLWCDTAQTATMLDNILVQDSAKSPPFTQCFGVDSMYVKHLGVFGEMCVVADTDNIVGRTKIDPRGKISLFVGKVLSSLTSANALISGLDPNACIVLAAIGSLAVVWLLVLEATGSSLVTPTGVSVHQLE